MSGTTKAILVFDQVHTAHVQTIRKSFLLFQEVVATITCAFCYSAKDYHDLYVISPKAQGVAL